MASQSPRTLGDIIAIFGSFVGENYRKKIDIDILIRFDETKGKDLLDLIYAEKEFKKIFKRRIDLLITQSS